MKKILAIIATVALTITMLCSVAFADSIAPGYWDLELNVRKADPANVKKDGVIGENEYDQIEIDNSQLLLNYYVGDKEKLFDEVMANAEAVRESIKYYISWDETNGLNIAVQYKPIKWGVNKYKNDYHEEGILFTKAGGLLLQISDKVDPRKPTDRFGIYMGMSQNENGELLYNTYSNQTGYANGHTEKHKDENGKDVSSGYYGEYAPSEKDACVKYDEATGVVTYEWSIPLNQVMPDANGKTLYFNLAVMGGVHETAGGWDDFAGTYSLNLGTWGFSVNQGILSDYKMTTANLSSEAVGYVEPEPIETPTPTETPEATVTPTENPGDQQDTKDANNGWMIPVMVVELVAIIALAAVVVLKKKK